MLGRASELADLDAGLARLAGGGGGLFLVSGEPGIGKTHLCDELARLAAIRNISVHWGRAWEVGGAPAYWPFIQILRSVGRALEVPALDLREGVRERFEQFDAVATYLQDAAARTPLVLVLDDLHAADPSSILMLHFLVRDLRGHALMVVGTYREAEARLGEVGRMLAQVAREAVMLPLRRLDRAEVAELVASTLGVSTMDAVDRIDVTFRRTEGNPLFVRELLRLRDPARQPDGIREVVRARLALLPPGVRATLEVAAVLGREFDRAMLAAVDAVVDLAHLAAGAEAGVVEAIDSIGRTRWRFSHVLLREGLYEDLPRERRDDLHRRAAVELRRRDGDPAEIAHHVLHANDAVPIAETAGVALHAAERAMTMLAFEDAALVLSHAADRLERDASEPLQTFEVLLALGVAHIRALDLVRGRETCTRAAAIARTLGDGERFARAILGGAVEWDPGIRDDARIAQLDEALAMLPIGDGALRARCMAQLAAERQPEPDTRAPIALARDAIAMARRVGDPDALRLTIANGILAMLAVADSGERILLDQEALRLALAANDKLLALRLHLFISLDCAESGDLAGSEAHHHAYEVMLGDRGTKRTQYIGLSFRATHALWRADFVEARRLANAASALAREDALARDGIGMIAFPVGFRRATEDYSDLPRIEAELRASCGSIFGALGNLVGEMLICQLYASAGDRDRTTALLAGVRAHPLWPVITEPSWLALLVDAAHLLGDRALATMLFPILAPHAERFFALGPLGCYIEPPYARALGILARTLGRADEAAAYATDALARTEQAGLSAWIPRLRTELATVRGNAPPAMSIVPDATLAFTLVREGEYWTIASGGATLRLRDSRGLQIIDRLVTTPGQELHVLELAGGDDGERDSGDAGTHLDPVAVQRYRARLLDLREELEEAEGFNDAGRSERARDEIEALTNELARAVGLGGRLRRTGGAAERARTAIQKRVRDAIRRIAEGLPAVGRHLDTSIRTGAFCVYTATGARR